MNNFGFDTAKDLHFQQFHQLLQSGSRFPFHHFQNLLKIDLKKELTIQNYQSNTVYPYQLPQMPLNISYALELFNSQQSQSQLILNPDSFYVKSEPLKVENETSRASETPPKEEDSAKDTFLYLKTQVTMMVDFFINELGKVEKERIEVERQKYIYSKALLELFDSLKEKYSAAAKCKEDMVRLALRKALTSRRDSLRKKMKISAKLASYKLCERYFGVKLEQFEEESLVDFEEKEVEMMGYLLPYKKNSKYSTPNACFIKEIFASETFVEDFAKFLTQFDKIFETDNQKKIEKFVDFLVGCVQKGVIDKVNGYKRLPWLKSWLKATKIVASELLQTHTRKNSQNKKRSF